MKWINAFGPYGIGAFIILALWMDMSGVSMEATTVYADKEVFVEATRDFPPALQAICNAESGGKQFKADGHVTRGHINPSDIGICQINEPYWNDKARDLGFDIFTEEGNKKMAIWLFEHQGTEPWNSSKAAWIKKLGK